jgi:hypothetical protein
LTGFSSWCQADYKRASKKSGFACFFLFLFRLIFLLQRGNEEESAEEEEEGIATIDFLDALLKSALLRAAMTPAMVVTLRGFSVAAALERPAGRS